VNNMKRIIIIVIIFSLAVGISGFWYYRKNIHSKEILKLEILGPEYVQTGEEIEYLARYKNNGNIVLENAEFIFDYPSNSIPSDSQDLRLTQKVEDIYPGEEKSFKFKTRLFGKENDNLTASCSLNYQPKGLKARYESKTTFTSRIKFVPLTFEFDLPLKTESGQELQFSLNYFSNINYPLENLRVKIEYPDTFEFKDSSPKALEKTEWEVSSLIQAGGGRIKISGKIQGEPGQQKIFRAKLGLYKEGNYIVLKEAAQAVQIVEPAIYISQIVNNLSNYIANIGDLLHYEIFFKNIGKTPIEKQFLIVKLEGDFFERNSLKLESGEAAPGDNSIIFDWKDISKLKFLDAGEEGKVEFWIKVKEKDFDKIKNPVLKNTIRLGGSEKQFETKINSKLIFSQKGYFKEDFFGNSGPLPPEAGKTTTYTIVWQVENSFNELSNLKVKAILPENVTATGKVFPEDARFTFDPQSREVMWNLGDLGAFEQKTLAFQIGLTPSENQKGKVALLIKKAEIIAQDTFTQDILKTEEVELSTILPDDVSITKQEGIVK